jgi:hypothetical protein
MHTSIDFFVIHFKELVMALDLGMLSTGSSACLERRGGLCALKPSTSQEHSSREACFQDLATTSVAAL